MPEQSTAMPSTGPVRASNTPPTGPAPMPPAASRPTPIEPWAINTTEEPAVSGSEMSPSAYVGSMQSILQQNTGYFVECEFLIGTQNIVRRRGILYQVGVSFLVLYETVEQRYTVCDFYALKFISFYEPGREPSDANMPRVNRQ